MTKIRNRSIVLVAVIVCGAFLLVNCPGPTGPGGTGGLLSIVYVDAAAPAGGDGSSWALAFRYLQDGLLYALERLEADDPVPEIRVAAGIYLPTDWDVFELMYETPREATFAVPAGATVYGGYPPGGGTRDTATHLTVLSGDVDQNDTTDANGIVVQVSDVAGENSQSVVTFTGKAAGSSVDSTTVLDGLVVTAAVDTIFGSVALDVEARALVPTVSPTINDVRIIGNDIGMDVFAGPGHSAAPLVSGSTFDANRFGIIADWAGQLVLSLNTSVIQNSSSEGIYVVTDTGAVGSVVLDEVVLRRNGRGGLRLDGSAGFTVATIINSQFLENSSSGGNPGAGVALFDSEFVIINSVFRGNTIGTSGHGGGAYLAGDMLGVIANCEFAGNNADADGGGLEYAPSEATSSLVIVNTTVTGNSAIYAGGFSQVGSTADATIANSIIWGNSAGSRPNSGGTPAFASSIIEGSGGSGAWLSPYGTDLGGNQDADPLFAATPDAGDGDWSTPDDNVYGTLSLGLTSPAVDSGDNAFLPADDFDLDADGNTTEAIPIDLAGAPRVSGGLVDMGALERP